MKTHWPHPSNRRPGLRSKMPSVTWDLATRRSTEIHPSRICRVNSLDWITLLLHTLLFFHLKSLSNTYCDLYPLCSNSSSPSPPPHSSPVFFPWKEASSLALTTARWLLSTSSATRLRSADEDANLLPKRFPTSQLSLRWRWRRRRPRVGCSFLPLWSYSAFRQCKENYQTLPTNCVYLT